MVPSVPMPAGLIAAAREARDDDELAVRLELAGACVIAVIGGEGDPREWWTAIWRLAGPDASVPLGISPRLQELPAGLSALAVRRGAGEVALTVSEGIEPERQRAAVQAALRNQTAGNQTSALPASRRADRRGGVAWRPGWLYASLVRVVRLGEVGLRGRIGVAVAMTAVVLVTASVVIAVSHGQQQQQPGLSAPGLAAGSAHNQAGGQSGQRAVPAVKAGGTGPASGASGSPTARGRAKPTSHPSAKPSASPTGSRGPSPSPSAPGSPTSSPSPTPSPTPTAPSQSPPSSPVPSASPTSSGSCVVILGIQVCV